MRISGVTDVDYRGLRARISGVTGTDFWGCVCGFSGLWEPISGVTGVGFLSYGSASRKNGEHALMLELGFSQDPAPLKLSHPAPLNPTHIPRSVDV